MIELLRKPQAHRLIAFLLGFAICLTFLMIMDETEAPYDSWVYTTLAGSFTQDGLFNFAGYAAKCGDSLRGYLLPWPIALGDILSGAFGYRVLISLFTSLICCVALPDLFGCVFGIDKLNPLRRLIPLGLLMVFFHGLLTYALSDIWAAGFAVLAALGLTHAVDTEEKPLDRVLFAALLGLSLGAAYNIRTIYLFLMIPSAIALLAFLICRRRISWAHKGLALAGALVGFLLISFPQMLINSITYSSWSFMLISPTGSSLFINQLYDGIYIMRYETNYGSEYWLDGMNYADAAGLAIIDQEGMSATYTFGTGAEMLGTVGEYIKLVLLRPLDMLGVYTRHLFSLLDVRYPNIYVTDLEMNHVLPIVNYLLLYTSGWMPWRGLWTAPKRSRLWLLALLLIPVLAILPGAIEPRFGLLLYLMLWTALATLSGRRLLEGMNARSWTLAALGCVAFVAVMCAFGGLLTASLVENPLLY